MLASLPRRSIVCLFFVLFALGGQAVEHQEIERKLKGDYEGKILTLRTFHQGARPRYDSEGRQLEGGEPGPWTLYGRVEVKKIALERDRLEIDGARLFLAYDDEKQAFGPIHGSEPVHIVVQLRAEAPTEAEIRRAVERVFLASEAELIDAVPPYWRSFFERKSAREERSGECPDCEIAPKERDSAESQRRAAKHRWRGGVGASLPQCVYCPDAEYSDVAREARHEGGITLTVTVSEEGRVEEINITKPLGLGMDEELVKAVARWRFEPGRRQGKPVSVNIKVESYFQLN